MKLAFWAALAALFLSGAASAQTGAPVTTTPLAVQSANASGTITLGNTFQSVFAGAGPANGKPIRNGCAIQNNGSATMWVFVGPLTNASKNSSYQLAAPSTGIQGGSFNCATGGGGVLQDPISITGTTNDNFAATSQ